MSAEGFFRISDSRVLNGIEGRDEKSKYWQHLLLLPLEEKDAIKDAFKWSALTRRPFNWSTVLLIDRTWPQNMTKQLLWP